MPRGRAAFGYHCPVMNRPIVLCFGETLWDRLPGGRVASGAPMNVAIRMVDAGFDVRMLSRVGADAAGRELLDFMAKRGLPIRYVQEDASLPTGIVEVDTTDPASPAFEIRMPVAWDSIDVDEYIHVAAEAADVIVFGTLAARHEVSRASLLKLLPSARLKVLDVNFRPPHDDELVVERLLGHADWVKLNETELARLAGWDRSAATVEHAMLEFASRYDLESVCVTLGEAGALLHHRGVSYRQDAFDVRVVDTVGCGDAFLGTMLAGLLTDMPPPEALARAAAAGALVAASAGATPVIGEADIRRMLAESRPG